MAESKNGAAVTTAKPTKTDAVGLALAELGKDASRADIQAFVKKHYGHDITLDHISNCKGELRKRAEKGKTGNGKPAAKMPVATIQASQKQASTPAAAAPPKNGKGTAVEIEDVLAVKGLVERVGAGHLRTLIAAFDK